MTAEALDRAQPRAGAERAQAAAERAALLTPIAKAFSTDIGVEVASLGVQVHGGMGYIEETGAAQHLRDARIAADLRRHQRHPGDRPRHPQAAAGRRRGGAAPHRPRCGRRWPRVARAATPPRFGPCRRQAGARPSTALERATAYMQAAMAIAGPTMRSRGRRPTQAVRRWPRAEASPRRRSPPFGREDNPAGVTQHLLVARFFAEQLATEAPALSARWSTAPGPWRPPPRVFA